MENLGYLAWNWNKKGSRELEMSVNGTQVSSAGLPCSHHSKYWGWLCPPAQWSWMPAMYCQLWIAMAGHWLESGAVDAGLPPKTGSTYGVNQETLKMGCNLKNEAPGSKCRLVLEQADGLHLISPQTNPLSLSLQFFFKHRLLASIIWAWQHHSIPSFTSLPL